MSRRVTDLLISYIIKYLDEMQSIQRDKQWTNIIRGAPCEKFEKKNIVLLLSNNCARDILFSKTFIAFKIMGSLG